MGLYNGKRMILRVADLPGNAAKIGMSMALNTYDDEARDVDERYPRRRFVGGARELANAIGKDWIANPKTAEDRHHNHKISKLVSESTRVLKNAGIIREIGRAVNGQRAIYEVLPPDLDPYISAIENADFTPDPEQRTES